MIFRSPSFAQAALLAAPLAFSLACGPGSSDAQGSDGSASATTESSGPTTAGPSSSSASTSDAMTAGESDATSVTSDPSDPSDTSSTSAPTTDPCPFICDVDMAVPPACDPIVQDCPEGQECTPYDSSGGNSWDATKCVDITGDAQVGEPCTANPLTEGGDDCDGGLICWYLDEELHGTCIAHCTGSEENPACPDSCETCVINGDGTLNLCLPGCDPLLVDCPVEGDLCVQDPGFDGHFACTFPAPELAPVGAPCEYVNACEAGSLCLDAAFFPHPDCGDADYCCAPICDTTQGAGDNPSCLGVADAVPGVECVGYSEGEPDACAPGAGACVVP